MRIHNLIEARAKATPHSSAIVAGEKRTSYQQLDARASQLAHLLSASGVGPEVPVGLCMQRSADLAIAALAVLKAGGAYLPLDPSYPTNRIAMILEDSRTPLLITEPGIAQHLPPGQWKTIVLDEDGVLASGYPPTPPNIDTKPDGLAYVIYTSGSTGRPKGVLITHANLLNLVQWHCEAFAVTSADRATMHASPGFDASVWEMWPHLAAGAGVYVIDEAVRTVPKLLRDWLVAKGITISFLPTALAEAMIDLSWPPDTLLRFLLTGADTLRKRPPAGLPFAFVNNYGPTECTVVATSGIVCPDEKAEAAPTIGSPITNTHVYVVDAQNRPVPPGTPGELLIGGRGVARGYLNLPESTLEKFMADPFSSESGARVYKTGDIGRLLPNGQIAFIGRSDDQIKIRGFRIEPNEITTALDRHPAIKASCVSTSLDDSGEVRLVAYVVASENADPNPRELRAFLRNSLPDYMIPSIFARLTELPTSLNGKVDRVALPKPTASNILQEEIFETPQSPTEERVASLMASLFKKRVGREDNFFTLGGHSLMGAQIIARIQAAFGVEVSLLSLFDRPTVRELSAEIERLIYEKVDAMNEVEAQRMLSSAAVQDQTLDAP